MAALSEAGLISLLLGGLMASGLFALTALHLMHLLAGTRQAQPTHIPASLKVALPFLWALDSLHFSFFVYALFVFLIKPQEKHLWSLTALLSTTVIRDTLVRFLMAQSMLTNNTVAKRLQALSVALLTLVLFLLGIVISFRDLDTDIKVPSFGAYSPIAFAYLALVLACDAALAYARLCAKLLSRREEKSNLECLIHAIVPCNVLAAVASLASLITIAVIPDTLVFIGIHCSLASFSDLAFSSSLFSNPMKSPKAISVVIPSSPITNQRGSARRDSPLPPLPPLDFPPLPLTSESFLSPSKELSEDPASQTIGPSPLKKLEIRVALSDMDKRSSPVSPFDDVHEVSQEDSQYLTPPPRFTSLFARSPTISSLASSEKDLHSTENETNSSSGHSAGLSPHGPSFSREATPAPTPNSPPVYIRPVPAAHQAQPRSVESNLRLHRSLYVGSGIEGIKALLDLKSPTPSVASSVRSGSSSVQGDARSIRSWRSKSASFARSASLSSRYTRPGTAESTSSSHAGSMEGWERRGSMYDPELGEDHDFFKADNTGKGAFGPYRLSTHHPF